MQLALVLALEKRKTIEIPTYPFHVPVNNSIFVEVLKALCNVLQL